MARKIQTENQFSSKNKPSSAIAAFIAVKKGGKKASKSRQEIVDRMTGEVGGRV